MSDNKVALLALVAIAFAAWLAPDAKEVHIGIASAIGGWMGGKHMREDE